MRIGPNQLLSVDPEVLRRMSAVRSRYTKGKFYASGKIVPDVDNVVSLRDPTKHKEMRALMAPGVCSSSYSLLFSQLWLNYLAVLW